MGEVFLMKGCAETEGGTGSHFREEKQHRERHRKGDRRAAGGYVSEDPDHLGVSLGAHLGQVSI